MKFLIDHQLPPALSKYLISLGYDCQHVSEVGLASSSDRAIWNYACDNGCVVVSKDQDFVYLAAKEPGKAQLIWVRLGNCRKTTLLVEFERFWPRILESLQEGDRVIELL